jgi:hypothetical protein
MKVCCASRKLRSVDSGLDALSKCTVGRLRRVGVAMFPTAVFQRKKALFRPFSMKTEPIGLEI